METLGQLKRLKRAYTPRKQRRRVVCGLPFGEAMLRYRKARNWTQQRMSEELGTKKDWVVKLEQHFCFPPPPNAKSYSCPRVEIFEAFRRMSEGFDLYVLSYLEHQDLAQFSPRTQKALVELREAFREELQLLGQANGIWLAWPK